MSQQNKTQAPGQKHAPMHNPEQNMPGGQHDDKHRQSQGTHSNEPNRTNQNPGVKSPGHEHDH